MTMTGTKTTAATAVKCFYEMRKETPKSDFSLHLFQNYLTAKNALETWKNFMHKKYAAGFVKAGFVQTIK